jgi:hypothetical protein
MLRKVAIAPPAMEAVPSAAPFSVAVTADAIPAKDAVSDPIPPSSRSAMPPAFAARIERVVARAARKGVQIGVPREAVVEGGPAKFSNPLSVSVPGIDRILRRALQGEATVTPAVAPA